MSIRSHRIKQIIHDDNCMTFQSGDALHDAIVRQKDANDQTNMDGGGIIEIPFIGLKTILKNSKKHGLNAEQVEQLTNEVEHLKALKTSNDSYIIYDMF